MQAAWNSAPETINLMDLISETYVYQNLIY